MNIVGIDPGKHGAIAILNDKGELISLTDIPLISEKRKKTVKVRMTESRLKEIESGKKVAKTATKETTIELVNIPELGRLIPHDAAFCIEKVGSMPGQGVTSMFSFGETFGILRGLAETRTRYNVTYPTPTTWQKHFGIKNETKEKKDLKLLIAKKAMELYPDANLYNERGTLKDGRSDALLIARYLYETQFKKEQDDMDLSHMVFAIGETEYTFSDSISSAIDEEIAETKLKATQVGSLHLAKASANNINYFCIKFSDSQNIDIEGFQKILTVRCDDSYEQLLIILKEKNIN